MTKIMEPFQFAIWLRRAKAGDYCKYALDMPAFFFSQYEIGDDTPEARIRDCAKLAERGGSVLLFHQIRKGKPGFQNRFDYVAQRSSLKMQIFADKIARNAEPMILAGHDLGD